VSREGGDKMNRVAVAKRLIELRSNKSQEEVANSVNISASALSMYENGERIPRDEIKIRLAKYYGKTVQYIFFNENDT
jgi:putative transcriptional regulator